MHKQGDFVFYSDIKELPIFKYYQSITYHQLENHCGSSVDDYYRHLQNVYLYADRGEQENLINELSNTYRCVEFGLEGMNFKALQLSCFVSTYKGEELVCNENEVEGLFLSNEIDLSLLDELQSVINKQLSTFFPAIFNNEKENEYFHVVSRLLMAECDQLLDQYEKKSTESLVKLFLEFQKPANLSKWSPEALHNSTEKRFFNLVAKIEKLTSNNIDDKTTLIKFYSLFDVISNEK